MTVETFTQAYIECAFWSSTDDEGNPLDGIPNEPSAECMQTLKDDAWKFYKTYGHLWDDDSQAGHDFWLTRNGHGAGFWDRGLGDVGDMLTDLAHAAGTCDLYVGDDGYVYASRCKRGREKMTYRTTIKTLRTLVETLNTVTGNPIEAWRTDGQRYVAIPGVYILDCAYGGYRLCRIVSEAGGERDITPRYGAAVTADLIRAYMQGLRDAGNARDTAKAA